jgi:succinate dehydrogenase/fumarate reductase cytochrome b subunit
LTNTASMHHPLTSIVTGIAFLLAAVLSAWIFIYSLMASLKARKFGYETMDLFPVGILVVYLILVLFFPAMNGLVDELATIAIFSIAYAVKLLETNHLSSQRYILHLPKFAIALSVFGVIAACLLPDTKYIRKVFTGASLYGQYQILVNNDVLQSALYLRSHARKTNIIMISQEEEIHGTLLDSAKIITSIAGIPIYVGNFANAKLLGMSKLPVRIERTTFMQSVSDAKNIDQAFSMMREHNISWYLALSPPKWDSNEKYIASKFGSVALYNIQAV